MDQLRLALKLAAALALIALALHHMSSAYAEVSPEDAKAKLAEAFRAVSEAERMGGDVSGLVAELNEAIVLIEEGEASGNGALIHGALLKAERVIALAPKVGMEGAAAAQARMFQSLFTLGLLTALAFIAWRYFPKVFWRLWVRSRSNWRVKLAGG